MARQWLAAEQQPVEEERGPDAGQQLDVVAGGDLAALAGALEDLPGGLQLAREEALLEDLGEVGIAAQGGHEARDATDLELADLREATQQQDAQVAAQRSGVDRRLLARVVQAGDGVDDQLRLAGPAAVQRRLARTGPGRHR